MRFGKTELLVLDRCTVFDHLHELAPLRIQTAITEVDDWRLRLFANDNAGRGGHHFSIVIPSESRKLLWFHERGFLAGIDSCPFNWRQGGILDRINVEGSGNDDAFGIGYLSDASDGQRPILIGVRPRRVVRVYVAVTVRATPTGFFIFAATFVTVNVIVVAGSYVSREGVLTQAGLN